MSEFTDVDWVKSLVFHELGVCSEHFAEACGDGLNLLRVVVGHAAFERKFGVVSGCFGLYY